MSSFAYRKIRRSERLSKVVSTRRGKGFKYQEKVKKMSVKAVMLNNDAVIFPLIFEREKTTETQSSEIRQTETKSEIIGDSQIEIKETRFTRLKKSIRKRSAGIL